ncbi:MAG: UvrB/UvrC motif-containing protein [Phycisphaerales bacterium]|nr:UvrB/UvrC motif-containing protein [Phycisphaerales bacterium]
MSVACQRCNHAKATVHITDTMPEKRERHLCDECAEKEGIIIKQKHTTTNEILQQFIKHKAGMSAGEDLACPKCGMTFRDFQTKGTLGCPHDYTAFGGLLNPLIQRAHEGATRHVGKVPPDADTTIQKTTGLLRLRRELQDAVEQENYELAARVRDQIRTLEEA